jgi:hypothetical protein
MLLAACSGGDILVVPRKAAQSRSTELVSQFGKPEATRSTAAYAN